MPVQTGSGTTIHKPATEGYRAMGTRQGGTIGGRMAVLLAGLAVAWLSAGVYAQPADPGDLAKPPPIPPETEGDVPIPPKIQDEQIEPTVTIRETAAS